MKPLAPVIAKVLPILRWGTALQSSGDLLERSSNFLRPTRANLASASPNYHGRRAAVRRLAGRRAEQIERRLIREQSKVAYSQIVRVPDPRRRSLMQPLQEPCHHPRE